MSEGNDLIDLPILGEPLPVELANTWYEGDEQVDVLDSAQRAARWLRAAWPEAPHPVGAELDPVELALLRRTRDVVRELMVAAAAGRVPAPWATRAVNELAAAAPSSPVLSWEHPLDRSVGRARAGHGMAIVAAVLADEAIDLVGGPRRDRIRACDAEGCPMLFVKNHHRRRWCHDGCGHRTRQARYYRRKQASAGR